MKPRIRAGEYANEYPDRINVCRFGADNWEVWQGWETLDDFRTHAEAITYAQREATKSLPTFATQHLRDCLCVYEPAAGHPGVMRKVFFDLRCVHDHPSFIRDEHPMEPPC